MGGFIGRAMWLASQPRRNHKPPAHKRELPAEKKENVVAANDISFAAV